MTGLFLRYQYILAFSDMKMSKLVESERGFKNPVEKCAKYLGISVVFKGQRGSLGANLKI